jgi:hypothetical protein
MLASKAGRQRTRVFFGAKSSASTGSNAETNSLRKSELIACPSNAILPLLEKNGYVR